MATIWCNGNWHDSSDTLGSLSDRGLMHGLGLFETLLAVDGRPAMIPRHLERMQKSAQRLGWSLPDHDLKTAMHELLNKNGLTKGHVRIRLALSGGSGGLSELAAGDDRLYWMTAAPMGPSPGALKIALSPWRRNEHSPLKGLKCASYAENLLALDWARQQGHDEVLFLNTAGDLCEAATANVFLVKDATLLTPALETGCLPGIMRDLIVELAPPLGHSVEMPRLSMEDISSASECFLTNAVHGVMPVTRIGDVQVPLGEVTSRLRQLWAELIIPR